MNAKAIIYGVVLACSTSSHAFAELTTEQLAHYELAGFTLSTRLGPDGRRVQGVAAESSSAPNSFWREGRTISVRGAPTVLGFVCPERGGRAYRITHRPSVSGLPVQPFLDRVIQKYGKPDHVQGDETELYWYWTPQKVLPRGDDFRYDFHGLRLEVGMEDGELYKAHFELHSVEGRRAVDQCEADRVEKLRREKAAGVNF